MASLLGGGPGAVSGPAMTVLAGVAPLNSANRSAAVPVWWATVCARVNSTIPAVAGAVGGVPEDEQVGPSQAGSSATVPGSRRCRPVGAGRWYVAS